MWICALEYVLEQFSDELAEESADPCDRATAMHCEQSYIKSVNATVTTTADAAAAAAVCMETSFGLESDEPRTHIFHSTQSEHQLSLQLVPGSLIGCFSCGLRQWFSNFFDHRPLFPQVQFAYPRTCYSKIYYIYKIPKFLCTPLFTNVSTSSVTYKLQWVASNVSVMDVLALRCTDCQTYDS